MKNSKILMFGILLVGMHLTSCKKDAVQQLQQGTQAANKEKFVEKSLIVYNADKTNSTTLRFRAASQEQLDKMALENSEFTLVETPESATEATDVVASTIPGDVGSSGSSNKNASLRQSTNEKQVLPKDGILVDLPFEPKTKSFSIEVKSKDLNNGTMRSATEQATAPNSSFYYHSGWHRIQVTNLHRNPIYVYFYYYLNGWNYTGYNYKLYKNGYAWYYNCSYTVGAEVSYPNSYNYRVNYYRSCN